MNRPGDRVWQNPVTGEWMVRIAVETRTRLPIEGAGRVTDYLYVGSRTGERTQLALPHDVRRVRLVYPRRTFERVRKAGVRRARRGRASAVGRPSDDDPDPPVASGAGR